MMRKSALFPLAVALALSACGGDKPAPAAPTRQAPAGAPAPTPVAGPKVSGSFTVPGIAQLPAGLELGVKLLDVTDPAALPVVVAERVTQSPRILPSGFEIGYDPAQIDAARKYVITVALQADGLVLYGTPSQTAVLTSGAPSEGLSLTLVQGGKAITKLAPPDQLKANFKELADKLGALRRITGERMEESVSVGWDAFVDDGSGQVLFAREKVEVAESGVTAYRYAYQGGQPWVIERKSGGTITMVGWTTEGQLILNDAGGAPISEGEVESLKQRALEVYATAAARR